MDLLQNKVLIAAAVAWVVSQVAKTIIHLIVNKKLDWDRLLGDGGMPSSHSATVTSMALTVGFVSGWDSVLFAIAVIFAIIVMHDATGVRQETGKQAKVINDLVETIQQLTKGNTKTPEEALEELVGHTPLQVFAGFGLGVAVAMIMHYLL